MASKTVQPLEIVLSVKGAEKLAGIKGSLRELGKAANLSGAQLSSLRKDILDIGKTLNVSEQAIKGQISALTGLQKQAGVGSTVYKELASDLQLLNKQLKSIEEQAKQTERALSFRGSQAKFIKQTPGALLQRIQQIQGAAAASPFDESGKINDEYINQQQQLSVLTKVQARLQERLALKIREGTKATIDNNNQNKTANEILQKYGKELNFNSRTTAGMSLALRELKEDFRDLTVGSKEYIAALKTIGNLERVMADPFGTSARKQQIRSRLGQLERFGGGLNDLGTRDPIQSSIERRERRMARRYKGYSGAGLADQPQEASGLFKQIAEISRSAGESSIQMMGRSYDQVAESIRRATSASNGSINSLNQQRSAWTALRNNLAPATNDYRKATQEIEKVDRALQKLDRRRRMSPMQMTQAAGAVLSGGIFGGPEGFLGGLGGAALGGVGGAFAGAAIGAQVGGLRRQLGEFADYAAEIKRLEIALKGITKVQDDAVASQANYSRAVAAAADVTKDLNVPQEVAIRGITRLTAAVKGAGGGVADAELAFKNITSAITATGGGAEQVQGAVTALVQIFSKGKVSAEEINQIAERLPGTFNKIAEASGRSGPELTKALQKGEVGLNDLMKFLVQLGGEYGELAKEIAGSSEAAGQRLQVAYNNMRIEVGNALRPIGAEFQDAFAEFIKDITPTLVELLPKIGEFALALASALDPANSLAFEVAGVATAVFLLKKAVDAYIGTKFAAIVTTHIALINTMGAKIYIAAAAQNVLNAALGVGKALLASLPVAAVLLGVVGLADALRQAATDQANFNKLLNEGTVDQLNNALATEKATLALERRFVAQGRGEGRAVDVSRIERSQKKIKQLEEALAEGMLGGGVLPYEQPSGLTVYEETKGDEDKGASKIARAMRNAEKLGVRLGRTLDDLRSKINGVGDTAEEAILRKYSDALRKADEQADDNIKSIIKLEKESGKSYPKIKENIEEVRDASKELAEAVMLEDIGKYFKETIERAQQPLNNLMESFNTQIRERARIEELMSKGMNKSLAEQIANIETIAAKEDEVLRKKIAQAETELLKTELGDKEIERLEKKIELLKKELELTPGRKEGAITSAKRLEEKEDTPADIITKGFEDAKKSLEDLVNLGNIAVNSANMIGEAFGNAFTDVVTGSATAKEALAGMMQSIGQSFVEMAAQIIAKQTTMIILGTIMKALGIAGGFGNPSADGISGLSTGSPSSFGGGNLFDGSVTSGLGGFRSNGGPVYSGRPYMVGERGPELFVPSSNGGVMRNEDMRQLMGRSPVSNAPAMNFTFETTNIGGQEFVSREQLEAAMATTRRQAASDGAKRGMNMTLDRMQNSPRTRARVGIA